MPIINLALEIQREELGHLSVGALPWKNCAGFSKITAITS